MKIYTKTGDDATTFHDGERIPKYSCAIDGQGEIDELNSWIGMIREKVYDPPALEKIQRDLFEIGAQLATAKMRIFDNDINELERLIDQMEVDLPPLKNFILPGKPAEIHVARAVCRRAERVVAAWEDSPNEVGKNRHTRFELVIPYLNRLSDYLFVLARFYSKRYVNNDETIWKGKESS